MTKRDIIEVILIAMLGLAIFFASFLTKYLPLD